MKRNIFFSTMAITAALLLGAGCKSQLDVGNPNAPTLGGNVNTEMGLIAFAQGGVFENGFAANGADNWLGDSYFSLPLGYHEVMADHVSAQASNNQVSTMGVPDYVLLDDGSKRTNTSPQVGIIRTYNTRSATGAGNNAIYYQWTNMYALNNAMNIVLSKVDGLTYSGDAASKKNTMKAWAYFWKGFAYASIGSMYISGLIIDTPGATNNSYVPSSSIIAESNKNYNAAITALKAVTSASDYSSMLGQLIPAPSRVGLGQVPTTDMWLRNINTLLARNIVAPKLAPFINGNLNATISKSSTTALITADWQQVSTLTTNGVKQGDYVFTARSAAVNYIFSPSGGTVGALTVGKNANTTYKITERFIQNFNTGDARLTANFTLSSPLYGDDYIYSSRYDMVDGSTVAAGVEKFGSKVAGSYELIIAGSYEENALLQAEANIRQGNTEAALTLIDAVRTYQGAGVAKVAGKGLSAAQAMTELTKESRVSLFNRGLNYYNARRWGWTYDVSKGGGSYGNVVVDRTGKIYTNATISYNFMDFWDVPADESVLNPTAADGVVKNPNF
ncbi:RagB/SusD family nutrient uptake outer membrane protein [Spirosoma terrae]|uniref:RagB/SusD family nutrient uptake outer membrane protein n=1 Tax=Spirosoma terrae TaxID=1968276 RepID=A0A6L9LA75_9BACT|nr:RagB/SusD family nutrient uptake outer membrane protein [Spirosoma terrae]NDU97416.1 RagB/SusD family nutrient uptake outer membrane protein [Spirosoma terrae]